MQFDSHRFMGTNSDSSRQYGLLDKQTGIQVICPYPDGVSSLSDEDIMYDSGAVAAMHRELSGALQVLVEERLNQGEQ